MHTVLVQHTCGVPITEPFDTLVLQHQTKPDKVSSSKRERSSSYNKAKEYALATLQLLESTANTVDMSLVVVTQYTTVFPTDISEVTSAPSISSTLSTLSTLASTTAVSSSAGLSSTMRASTSLLSSVSTSFTTSMSTSSTSTPPLRSGCLAPGVPKPKFNDTFAYVILAVVVVLAVLLLAIISYLILLCCRGQCPKCSDMKSQLAKWESGQLKRITKDMVKKREARNGKKSATSSLVSSDSDIEMGFYGDRASAHMEALDQLEGNTKQSLWQKAKSKMTGRSPSSSRTPSPPADIDRFFTVDVENGDPDTPGTYRIPPHAHQPRDEYTSPPRHHSASSSSQNSQPTSSVRVSRVFADHAGSAAYPPRGPLMEETDEPKSYTAYTKSDSSEIYNPRPKQLRVRLAEEGLHSAEYKEAESVIARGTAPSETIRRALSIVNFADASVNIARRPSLYSEIGVAQPAAEQPIADFRNDCQQAPVPGDVPEDYSGYLAKELGEKRKP